MEEEGGGGADTDGDNSLKKSEHIKENFGAVFAGSCAKSEPKSHSKLRKW